MIRTTDEFVVFTLSDRDGADLSGDAVSVAIVAEGPVDGGTTWLPCTFISSSTDSTGKTSYKFRTTNPVNFTSGAFPGDYWLVYAKLVDSPETPVAAIGGFTLDD